MKGSLCLWGGFIFRFFSLVFLHTSLLTSATVGHSWMRDLKYWRLNLGESREGGGGALSSIESVSPRHQIRTQKLPGPAEVNLCGARLRSPARLCRADEL